jgi:valyl-tRNA synthetase
VYDVLNLKKSKRIIVYDPNDETSLSEINISYYQEKSACDFFSKKLFNLVGLQSRHNLSALHVPKCLGH